MKKLITFTLPAELVGNAEAILLGEFNNWNPENAPRLAKQADGNFSADIELEEGKTYQYRFLLSDGRWVNDHNAQGYVGVPGMHVDNCVITLPESIQKEKEKKIKKVDADQEKAGASIKTKAPAKPKSAPAKKKATSKTAAGKETGAKITAKAAKKTGKQVKTDKQAVPAKKPVK